MSSFHRSLQNCLLVRPGGINPKDGGCRGGDSPLGNGDPVSILCVKIHKPTTIVKTRGNLSQSATITTCFQVGLFFWAIFSGFVYFPYILKTCWVVLLMTLIIVGLAELTESDKEVQHTHVQWATSVAEAVCKNRKSGHFQAGIIGGR